MPKVLIPCDLCGATFFKTEKIRKHNFCCREHFYAWNAKRIAEYNQTANPMNQPGGVMESRLRRGEILRNRGEGKTYRKYLGRHEHRHIAEQMLGRSLRDGEIVHHRDGNKRNNDPANLEVLPSQAEHARRHFTKAKAGDAK
ncbi:MAG: HNH endonuclease [Oscillospiraceae bacterium]|nr:HNH endonuclease [Oscillospiraceae bacterium]